MSLLCHSCGAQNPPVASIGEATSAEPAPKPEGLQIDVVGAGMAGLLAAAMLRKDCNAVFDAQASLPNNHHAVLRFRSSVVGDAVGVEFRKVQAMKAVAPWRNSVADAMAYSKKANGCYLSRSIASADGSMAERFIAPPDFIARLARAVEAPMQFGEDYPFWSHATGQARPVISTVPMPTLMDLLDYPGPRPEFGSVEGWTITAAVPEADAFWSLYVPDPNSSITRISLTGDRLAVECWRDPGHGGAVLSEALALAGISAVGPHEVHRSRYAKITPVDDEARKRFILWASEERNVYSLGRFATWRPGLLLDDVVNDVRVITKLIRRTASAYESKKA